MFILFVLVLLFISHNNTDFNCKFDGQNNEAPGNELFRF
jgi:uncharacterized integral membrane protein